MVRNLNLLTEHDVAAIIGAVEVVIDQAKMAGTLSKKVLGDWDAYELPFKEKAKTKKHLRGHEQTIAMFEPILAKLTTKSVGLRK